MDGDENQEQLVSKTSLHGSTATLVEQIPLITTEPTEEDQVSLENTEIVEWNTSKLCEVNDEWIFIQWSRSWLIIFVRCS